MELRVTILDRSFDPVAPMWGDCTGGWQPPGPAWAALLAAYGVPFHTLADLEGDDRAGLLLVPEPDSWPEAVDQAADAGRPLITGPPPEQPGDAVAMVRRALGALVRPDLRGVLVLRLDDPGASTRRHLSSWRHADVDQSSWSALWSALAGFGRASVFCCPGWVRADGRVVPSREVVPREWEALDHGVAAGLVDLECHGYTHTHPDTTRWASAADRADNEDWYREMWPPGQAEEPSAEAQVAILRQWQSFCGPGTALVAPGEAWGPNTLEAARRAGFRLFNSWSVCRLDQAVPIWTRGIGSPYLDRPEAGGLAEGLPTVGYWHDRDMAMHGPDWVPRWLEAWRDCGAQRAWAFSDLARAWSAPIEAALVDGEVAVRSPASATLLVEREP